MTDDNIFYRPVTDWTDDELRHGLAECGRRVEELGAGLADPVARRAYEYVHFLACVIADERDNRRMLAREVDEAMSSPAVWLDDVD